MLAPMKRFILSTKKFAYLKYPIRAILNSNPEIKKTLLLVLSIIKPRVKFVSTEIIINIKYLVFHHP